MTNPPLSRAPGDLLPPRSRNLKGVTAPEGDPLRCEYAPTCFDEENNFDLGVFGAAIDANLGIAPGLPVCPGVSSRQF